MGRQPQTIASTQGESPCPHRSTRSNPAAVRAPTGYSHPVRITGDYRRLIISGQVGMAPDGTVPLAGEGQIAQALANLRAVLAANGMSVENVVKTTAFLTDRGLLDAYRQSRSRDVRRPRAGLHAAVRRRAGRPALGLRNRSRSGDVTWT